MKRFLLLAAAVAAAATFTATSCCDSAHRQAMDFLKTNMPAGDRDTLTDDFLNNNIDWALRARGEFEWAKNLPDSIFLNEVLPYAMVDEPREEWRETLYNIFAPKVRGAADIREAIALVSADMKGATGVSYNTRRRTTNQSPSESMEQGMASCTGLSILLVDAFRSVGIPARFAGTASWYDDRGNHSWVEVWIDGEWHFTEFTPDPKGLDHGWLLASAGKANPADRNYAVWATSFKPTGESFPMVWSPESNDVPGVNVTDRYIALYNEITAQNTAAETHVPVRFVMWKSAAASTHSDDRVAANVDVFHGADQVGGGRTTDADADMNDVLVFSLEKNAEYTFMYADAAGEIVRMKVAVGQQPMDVNAYME